MHDNLVKERWVEYFREVPNEEETTIICDDNDNVKVQKRRGKTDNKRKS